MTYRVRQMGDSTEILLYDEIGDEWFGGVSAKQFRSDVKSINTSEIVLRVNSPGGDALDGRAMYNALMEVDKAVIAHVDGLAASAATMPLLAADKVYMGRGSMIMIHNAWTLAAGDHHELRRVADVVEKISEDMIPVYASYSGKDEDEIRQLLDAETWFNAEEAIEAGFAEGMSADNLQVAAAVCAPGRYKNTPKQLLGDKPKSSSIKRSGQVFTKTWLTKQKAALA